MIDHFLIRYYITWVQHTQFSSIIVHLYFPTVVEMTIFLHSIDYKALGPATAYSSAITAQKECSNTEKVVIQSFNMLLPMTLTWDCYVQGRRISETSVRVMHVIFMSYFIADELNNNECAW